MKEIEKNNINNILITRTDKLGDVILTLPLISETKRIFPKAKITFLINSYVKDILSGYEDIDELAFINSLPKDFYKNNKFDLAINVYPRFKLAKDLFRARITYRVGSGFRWYSFLYNRKVKEHRKDCNFHEAQYNLNLLKAVSDEVQDKFIFKFKYSLEEKNNLFGKVQINSKYIIIHPGSRGSARDLPINKITQFIKKFAGNHSDYKIVLTGSDFESGAIAIILNDIPIEIRQNIINLCGKLGLRELMILIDNSNLFISNSTGPIHIAGALNKNIIGFYPNEPPVNDKRWGPLSKNAIILNPPLMGGAMDTIPVSEILKSADKILLSL